MRVLWIAPNGGLYKQGIVKGTGGWIGSLQKEIMQQLPNLELGIAFKSHDNVVIKDSSITYFPVSYHSGGQLSKITSRLFLSEITRNKRILNKFLKIVNTYNPDVVHIWGFEDPSHAMLVAKIDVPCVVHIQGLTSFIIHAYCPPYFSIFDLKKADWISPRAVMNNFIGKGIYSTYKNYCYRAEIELKYGPYVKNWIGRTEWDKIASRMLSPKSQYFHGDEIMRDDFNTHQWQFHYNGELIIQSSLSADWYKGIDIVLRTADIMKKRGYKFIWNIFGVNKDDTVVRYMKFKTRINPNEVSVVFHGKVPGNIICDSLLSSDVFVHTSYIENSSNAVAEAMQLGLPIIVQNVGGLSSLLTNNSGVLVPSNEPYILADSIMKMQNKEVAEGFAQNAYMVAKGRGNSKKTIQGLINIYEEVMK